MRWLLTHLSTIYRISFFRIEYSLLQKSLVLFWISLFHIYYRLQEANNYVIFFIFQALTQKNEFIPLRAHFKSKIFIFFPSHSHTSTLSIVIERRYTSSHHNWIASSAVPLLGKQRDNPNLSGERAKKAWQHAARPAQRLPCRAQRREGLPVWNLQGEKNAKPI